METSEVATAVRRVFAAHPGVIDVEIRQEAAHYTVNIIVEHFDRAACDPIYDKQLELVDSYKDASFEFHILNDSVAANHSSDATSAQRSLR